MPTSERRIKRSPLRDVAEMVRSIHDAAWVALDEHVQRGSIPPDDMPRFEPWLRYWTLWNVAAYLRAYFSAIVASEILPANEEDLRVLFRAYLINSLMSECGRELNAQPSRLSIPLSGLIVLMHKQVPQTPTAAAATPATANVGTK